MSISLKSKLSCLCGAFLIAFAALGYCGVTAQPASAMTSADCPKGSLFKTKPSEAKKAEDIHTYADCNMTNDNSLMKTIQIILNVIVGVVGIAAVAVIILGGVTFVTSQGDAAKVTKGKNTIIYGIVGLIISLLAFAIVNFVLSAVFK